MGKQARIASAIVVSILFGEAGCTPTHSSIDSPPPAMQPAKPAMRPLSITRSDIGTSVEGRPITMIRFGEGDVGVLIIAAIHGDEPTSEYVAQRLITVLASAPRAGVAVIPCANPDGLAAHRRTNAHGVDLNRNFPAANWKRTGHSLNFGGRKPLSEPESAALHGVIEHFQPRLIISIHSMRNPCDNYDGPADQITQRMSLSNGYPVLSNIGYPTPGSLGSWAGVDRQIPIITLELPRAQAGEDVWLANRDALLSAISSQLRS